MYAKSLQSCLFVTLWTLANQAPLSMGFSRQEYWGGLLCPPPGDLTNQGWNLCLLCLLHWQANSLPLVLPGKPMYIYTLSFYILFCCGLSQVIEYSSLCYTVGLSCFFSPYTIAYISKPQPPSPFLPHLSPC